MLSKISHPNIVEYYGSYYKNKALWVRKRDLSRKDSPD